MCNNILLVLLLYLLSFIPSNKCLLPVILVPGLTGSRLEAELDKPKVVRFFCLRRTYGYYILLWLDALQMLPLVIDCLIDNLRLNYDSLQNITYDQPGVYTRVRGFGNPRMVEYLNDISQYVQLGYLNDMVEGFIKRGYSSRKTLFAAPYDFRKGPSELNYFFEELKRLTEKAYNHNNQSPVILIGHSYGGSLILKLLQKESKEWKEKYVRAFISLGTPYGGTMTALKVFLSGENLGIPIFDPKALKKILSTMPSLAYLLPVKELWNDDILVSTPCKNYTVDNLKELFETINNPTAWKMYLNEEKFAVDRSPPGVETYCCYSEGSGTVKRLVYGYHDFPDDGSIVYENGDGVVNLRSLLYCANWMKKQKEKIVLMNFQGINHIDLVHDHRPLNYIISKVIKLSQFYDHH